jgi:hypothetical protein
MHGRKPLILCNVPQFLSNYVLCRASVSIPKDYGVSL